MERPSLIILVIMKPNPEGELKWLEAPINYNHAQTLSTRETEISVLVGAHL